MIDLDTWNGLFHKAVFLSKQSEYEKNEDFKPEITITSIIANIF